MYRAAITNKGRAWLDAPTTTPLCIALHAIADTPLEGEDPAAVEQAFYTRVAPLLGQGDLPEIWEQLGRDALIKVRQPAPAGLVPEIVLEDPPIEHYRAQRGWGGRREGGCRGR